MAQDKNISTSETLTNSLSFQPIFSGYDTSEFLESVNQAYQHWQQNEHYQDRVHSSSTPERVSSLEDLYKLPTVDMAEFKGQNPLAISEPDRYVTTSGTSSGTRGRIPVTEDGWVLRHQNSQNIAAAVLPDIDNAAVLSLPPELVEKAPEPHSSRYIFNILPSYFEQFDDTEYFIEFGENGPDLDIEGLSRYLAKDGDTGIAGVPSKIYPVMQKLKEERYDLGEDGTVITGGGWKGMDGVPNDEFRELAKEVFNVDEDHHTDFYAATEFTGFFANKVGDDDPDLKRVPSNMFAYTVDEDALLLEGEVERTEEGEEGLLVVIDPLNIDAPGVILTDDVVRKTGGEYGEDVRIEHVGRGSM